VTSFFSALRHQGNVFLALLNREEERRRHNPVEALLGVLEPLGFLVVMAALRYFTHTNAYVPVGTSQVVYLATGILPHYFFIVIATRSSKDWTSASRRFPIEQRLDLYLVAIILRCADYLILGVLLFGGLYAYGISDAAPYDYGSIFQALAAIAMLGFGWGVFQLTIGEIFPVWAYINGAITRGLVLFSGIFFEPDTLPPDIRYPLSFNPILQAIALFKRGFYPNYSSLTLDKTYLLECAIAFVLMGLIFDRITRRREGLPRRRVRR